MTRIISFIRQFRFVSGVSLLITSMFFSLSVFSMSSEEIFNANQDRLFQIKLIDIESDSKSSLGSGFVVGDAYTVATNYHVVASAVDKTDKYRIQYVRDDGTEGTLSLYDIDIVNDLALLKSEESLGEPIPLAALEPNKGAVIYALGNPLDLGMTVVSGTYNGLADNAYYQRIHFSGSINSGMSGGPVLNDQGEIVGVNVATAGNQVSFLVPVTKLNVMLELDDNQQNALGSQDKKHDENFLLKRAEAQLIASQSDLMSRLFADEWPEEHLAAARVIGEIPGLVSCWGRSSGDDDDDKKVIEISKGCSLQDSIFVNRSMTTGSLEYEFYWFDANGIDSRKFYRYLQGVMGGYPGNRAGKDDVSEFQCEERFTNVNQSDASQDQRVKGVAKSFYCARRYKQFSSLYDVFYFRMVESDGSAFFSHFTLAGVTQESATRFASKFVEHVTWP